MPLTIDLEKAINYHIGIFAFTGSGKSNLTASLIRRILKTTDMKIVIVDISMEYAVLLLDQLLNVDSRLVSTERLPINSEDAARKFLRTHVLPEEILDLKNTIKDIANKIYPKMRQLYVPPQEFQYLSLGDLMEMVRSQINDKYTAYAQKPLFGLLLRKIDMFMRERKLNKDDIVDDSIIEILEEIEETARNSGLKDNSSIFTFINTLKAYINSQEYESEDYDIEKMAIEILESSSSSPRLFILELPNIEESRSIVASLINEVMNRRKRFYSTSPIIFVIDEAQEFIPFDTRQKDKSELSSNSIEKLLRHGRKYHLHALISTQRLAYLNTNVLQQLHTYFISTLPRPYDRQLISETFGINDVLMDRTLDLEIGQWLLVSFKAALPHDVPVFFTAENNLTELRTNLTSQH
jgi:DNA helicase HerA-like ATPase